MIEATETKPRDYIAEVQALDRPCTKCDIAKMSALLEAKP